MIRPSRRWLGGGAMALLGVLGQLSCASGGNRETKAKYTAELEDEVDRQAPSHLGGPLGGQKTERLKVRPTPQLSAPIETLDDTAVVRYLNRLEYDTDLRNSQLVHAQCVHVRNQNAPCPPASEGADVYIEPEIGVHKWKHGALPKFGFVIARIINYDPTDRQEKTFELPPSTRVWWVVDVDPATNKPRSRFFRRNYHELAPAVEQVGVARDFLDCHHNKQQYDSKAKFVKCANSRAFDHSASLGDRVLPGVRISADPANVGRLASFSSAVPLPFPPQPAELLEAAWITCEMGCCATM